MSLYYITTLYNTTLYTIGYPTYPYMMFHYTKTTLPLASRVPSHLVAHPKLSVQCWQHLAAVSYRKTFLDLFGTVTTMGTQSLLRDAEVMFQLYCGRSNLSQNHPAIIQLSSAIIRYPIP